MPGPWSYCERTGLVTASESNHQPSQIVTLLVTSDHKPGTRRETHATGRLIAASPALLEALKELLEATDDCVDYISPGDSKQWYQAVERTYAAIEKAERGSP